MAKREDLDAVVAQFERDAAALVSRTVLQLRTVLSNPDVAPRSTWVPVKEAMKLYGRSRKVIWGRAQRTEGASWKDEKTGHCWVDLDLLQIGPPGV